MGPLNVFLQTAIKDLAVLGVDVTEYKNGFKYFERG